MADNLRALESDQQTVAPIQFRIEKIDRSTEREAEPLTGRVWQVTILGPTEDRPVFHAPDGNSYVVSKNNRLYDTNALARDYHAFEGVRVFDAHLSDFDLEVRGGFNRRPAQEWLGSLKNVRYDPAGFRLVGDFVVVDRQLQSKLVEASVSDLLDAVGLSVDVFYQEGQAPVTYNGQSLPTVVGFNAVNSVDLVDNPAAGGRFNRALASKQKEQSKQMFVIADLLEKLQNGEALSVEELAFLEENINSDDDATTETESSEEEAEDESTDTTDDEPAGEEDENLDTTYAQESTVAELQTQLRVDRALEGTRLSPEQKALIRAHFDGRTASAEQVQAYINRAIKAFAASDLSGQRSAENVSGRTPKTRITGMVTGHEFAEVAFLRLIAGATTFNQLFQSDDKDTKKRLRAHEASKAWIKAGRPNVWSYRLSDWTRALLGGDPFMDPRLLESGATTATMSSSVKNAVNILLAHQYSIREEWWRPIVREEEVDSIDQATLVRHYGVNTLDEVGEGAAYTALAWDDDEETAVFVKKGNYLPVTLEMMLRDKVAAFRQIPINLADSWFNTLSDLVSNVFTINSNVGPTLSDTGALFNATAATTAGGHANLLTTAMGTTTAALKAVRTAMRKQTSQNLGVGRRLGITPRYVLVPYDIQDDTEETINSEVVPGQSNDQRNVLFRQTNVIGVPQWTDANDWAAVADPMVHPAIWLMFLTGRKLPEIYEATSENGGSVFTNDELRFKVRLLTWKMSATDNCAPVSDFRALHKNNVA